LLGEVDAVVLGIEFGHGDSYVGPATNLPTEAVLGLDD
jgi:hypothetical protein